MTVHVEKTEVKALLKEHECPSCNYTGLYDSVNKHYQRHHQKKDKKTYHEAKREREAKRDPSSFPFCCEICGTKFKKYISLYSHTARTHKKQTEKSSFQKR